MYFLTVIADLWVVNIHTYLSMLYRKTLYTCSSIGSQSGKICIGSHGSFVYRCDNSAILLLCEEKEQEDSLANGEERYFKMHIVTFKHNISLT